MFILWKEVKYNSNYIEGIEWRFLIYALQFTYMFRMSFDTDQRDE